MAIEMLELESALVCLQLQKCLLPRSGITCAKARFKLNIWSGFLLKLFLGCIFCWPLVLFW